jgi:hypothetical protein
MLNITESNSSESGVELYILVPTQHPMFDMMKSRCTEFRYETYVVFLDEVAGNKDHSSEF